ncbi:MAG: hypothetical protein IKU80_01005, partial [Firmicutes bacterium]|nr:hypothetical protein [Bacillota bacterium]
MKIIKRSGTEVGFDLSKITGAVRAANNEVEEKDRLTEEQIMTISNNVEAICNSKTYTLNVEEIQDLVEN